VVTGISLAIIYGDKVSAALGLQWGPVVVTGISGQHWEVVGMIP